jgi:uncharacterized membrane protein YsdA (DUF1294 family)
VRSLPLALLYLLTINAAAFAAFARDKRLATAGARRIPERVLLQMAAIGGIVGALAAQRMLRHKTRKEPFRTWLLAIAALQAVTLGAALVWLRQG